MARRTTADHVSRRNFLRWVKKNVDDNQEVEMDVVVNYWEDMWDGRKVVTANGHIVESNKGIGETIRLMRRGLVWMEA